MEKVKLTNDYVFKSVFGREDSVVPMKALLEAVLKRKVENVEIQLDLKFFKEFSPDKEGIVDTKVDLVDTRTRKLEKVAVEMQILRDYNINKRTLFYWSKLFSEKFYAGEPYNKLKKAIVIVFLDYERAEDSSSHIKFDIVGEDKTGKVYSDVFSDCFEVHYVELKRIDDPLTFEDFKNDAFLRWGTIIKGTHGEWVEKMSKTDEAVKKVVDKVKYLSADEEERRMAELRGRWLSDQRTYRYQALEEGREEGRAQGRAQGRVEGRVEGRAEGQSELIKKLVNRLISSGLRIDDAIKEVAETLEMDGLEVKRLYDL